MKFEVMGYPIWGWLALFGIVAVVVWFVVNPGEPANPCSEHELGSTDWQQCEDDQAEFRAAERTGG